jgi:putative ABC transport system permease protein
MRPGRTRRTGSDRERDRDEEMRAHIDLFVEELVDRGVPADEAERQARLRFGNPRAKLEEIHDMNRIPFVEAIWRDARYAIRILLRTPAFTFTAVTTLALVIGATTAVLSLADALLWRPLPFPEPEKLAGIIRVETRNGATTTTPAVDGAMFEAVRDRVPSLDVAVMGSGGGVNLVLNGTPVYASHFRVSEGFSRVLGVAPARGRWFNAEEDRAGGPAVAVLSYQAWHRYFAAAEDVIGRSVLLRGEPHQIVGVMPAGFRSLDGTAFDLWVPLRASTSGEGGGDNFWTVARLKPGASWAQAGAELVAVRDDAFRLQRQSQEVTRDLGVQPIAEILAKRVREPIVLLSSAVLAVLLIACVNLASLMLARADSRTHEIATRMALGGGRRIVVRQLMVEAVIIAGAGGLAGLLIGYFGLKGLQNLGGERFEQWGQAAIDARVIALAIGLSALTSLAFGLAPAIRASRLNVAQALTGARGVAGRASRWPRRVLVISEVALGVVLLVATGLLIRTFVNVRSLDPGFNRSNLVTASVSLRDARYNTAASINQLFDQSLNRLTAVPGIESAAISLEVPYERLLNLGFRYADDASADTRMTNLCYVTPGFLKTMGIGVKSGRDFADQDRAGTPAVALVNQAFERMYSKDRPAIGRRIRTSGPEREIVGVVGDVKVRPSLGGPGFETGPLVAQPLILILASQTTDSFFRLVHTWFTPVWTVRARDTGAASVALTRAISESDPLIPVSSVRGMDTVMAEAITEQKLMMTLVGLLAGAAILLAAIGVHGVIAHTVAERRREFGIRIALGATAINAVRSVSLGGIALAGIGAVIGAALSVPATSLVRSFLWRVETNDPWTYAGVAIALLAVATLASVLPALRLLRLNPAETLRN